MEHFSVVSMRKQSSETYRDKFRFRKKKKKSFTLAICKSYVLRTNFSKLSELENVRVRGLVSDLLFICFG